MKYFFFSVLSSVFVMSSCSNNNDALESENLILDDFPQTWKLVKMTGSIEGFESVGQEMDWQENYVLKSDGTFIKTRITEGQTESASGSYLFENENQHIILNFNQFNSIIGNCFSDAKEYLYFNQNRKKLLNNWWACDGPGLFYERIK